MVSAFCSDGKSPRFERTTACVCIVCFVFRIVSEAMTLYCWPIIIIWYYVNQWVNVEGEPLIVSFKIHMHQHLRTTTPQPPYGWTSSTIRRPYSQMNFFVYSKVNFRFGCARAAQIYQYWIKNDFMHCRIIFVCSRDLLNCRTASEQ